MRFQVPTTLSRSRPPTDLSDDEFETIRQRGEQDTAKDGPPSDADLMKEIDKMNELHRRGIKRVYC